MKIIYVTTSLEENDYNKFNKLWKVSLNPSNQNFHNKIIRALSLNNEVEVISIRPYSHTNCTVKSLNAQRRQIGNITYNYLSISKNRFLRLHSIKKQSKKLLSDLKLEKAVIVTDTINPKCIVTANYLHKRFNYPAVGICTDSPSNITGTSRSYTLYLLNQSAKLDGFITLTEGLNMLFNKENKEHINIEGVVESSEIEERNTKNRYFFFGGALLPRYGVYNLIKAFKKIEDKKVSLLICGHHADEEAIKNAIRNEPRIKYLGTLPIKEVLELEKDAIANINPRPFTQDLDRLSIPSKTLEYLSSNSVTISVRNTELESKFANLAIWAQSGEVEDLYLAMDKALKMSPEERKKMAYAARTVCLSLYSIEKIGKKLSDFLANFVQ